MRSSALASSSLRPGGRDDDEEAGQEAECENPEVSEETFSGWLQFSACPHGSAIAGWWTNEPAGEEGDVTRWKSHEEECVADLYQKIKLAVDGAVRVRSLVRWFIERGTVGSFSFCR